MRTHLGIRRPAVAVLASLLLAASTTHAQTTAFRMNDLDLRDPHVWVNVLGCRDVTDVGVGGVGPTINGQIQTLIQTDGDDPPDGLLDLSALLVFSPLDQTLAGNAFDYGSASCTAPLVGTTCAVFDSAGLTGTAALQPSGLCLDALAGTTSGYTPALLAASGPCFASPEGTLTLDLAGIPVPLQNAQVAATFVGTPATSLSNGLLKGFVTEAVANATIIPADIPLIGGRPLSAVLAGGTNSCRQTPTDKDSFNGVPGWWFYMNFTAPAVPLTEPLPDKVFGSGFENP